MTLHVDGYDPQDGFEKLSEKLLETDEAGNFFEPLIGPGAEVVDFNWGTWSLVILPDGTWRYHERG